MRRANALVGKASGSNSTGDFRSESPKIDYQVIFEDAPALFLLLEEATIVSNLQVIL